MKIKLVNPGPVAMLVFVCLWAGGLLTWCYGLWLAFSASLVLGVIAFFLAPSPLILGVLGLLGRADVAKKIADWVGL